MSAVPVHKHFTVSDGVLIALAIVGAVLFVLLLPRQHPDAAASYRLGQTEALEIADAFLASKGYATDGLDATAHLKRQTTLIDSLQASPGRAASIRLLQTETSEQLPAYFWEIRYREQAEQQQNISLGSNQGQRERFRVSLTLDGNVWAFHNEFIPTPGGGDFNTFSHVDHEALQAAFAVEGTEEGVSRTDLRALSDSTFRASLRFDFGPLLASDTTVIPPTVKGEAALAQLRSGGTLTLDALTAAAMARHHFSRTALDAASFQVDSVWVLPGRRNTMARVRFLRTEALEGQHTRADLSITSAGALRDLKVDFNPGPERSNTLNIIAAVIEGGGYALLVIILLILFFRRLKARLIDVSAAALDAAVLGVLFAVYIIISRNFVFDQASMSVWLRILIGLFVLSVASGLMAIFVFILSGATDSMSRVVWPKKVLTSSLVRQGDFRNTLVGAALLRGIGLALVLLGLTVGLLSVFPQSVLDLGDSFLPQRTFQPMLSTSSLTASVSYLNVLLLLLGVGSFFYQIKEQNWLMVVGITLGAIILDASPASMAPGWYAWALSGLTGLALGLAFWRYDLLTCFIGLFVAKCAWSLNEGWLIENSPVWMDHMTGSLFMLSIVVVGLVGVFSRRSGRNIGEYIPSYIQEMAGQERVKRELEIAHQVQASFLPRKMPRVEGLDLAGMCLPAQEVGGDYYDFIEIAPGRLALVVGDVSGKGIEAAFYMTLTKGFLRTLCKDIESPAEVMRRLNTLFCENAPRGTFISMIYGVVDVGARTFTFARAGHNPLILKRSPSQEADLMQPAGLAIGLAPGPPFNKNIEEVTINLRMGDVLVFYTDGFSEAMNSSHQLYGDDRLAAKVGHVGHRSASQILSSLTEDVHHFIEAEGRHDDMTMVVVKLARK